MERLIGILRREFLDQVLFWNARDLERKLAEFQVYYSAARCRASLAGHTPLTFAGGHSAVPADLNHVRWVSHCRDLSNSQSPPDTKFETDRRRFQCDGGLGIFPSRIAACHANVAMTMADSFRSSSFMRSG